MQSPPLHIAILGSTGSIGCQALEVVAAHPGRFRVQVLTAQRNADLLIAQALIYKPAEVVIGDAAQYEKVKTALAPQGIAVSSGEAALCQAAARADVQLVLTALVGFAGLRPTLAAIHAGKDIALANKETLVVAGQLVMAAARAHQVQLLPVDSEHSAIYQCLVGEAGNAVEKIYLTASGGPFRGYSLAQLQQVTREQALKHPNWSMGAKITIDSASMMNKGLEVIEAHWLFGLPAEQIQIVVHPQSIVHSMVQFADGSIKAQLGTPDMRLPIQYALGYPARLHNNFPRFDFAKVPTFTFEQIDRSVFRSVQFAYDALARGGNGPCVLNAANEVAVAALLEGRIQFVEIYDCVAHALTQIPHIANPSLDQLFQTDAEARRVALTALA